ncbi:hypothetical protein IMZ29_15435 [Achromobacter sp. GG226]|uniref:hypothetical protein n=1 Tax=Verticiella alkaliphila TaxID=2779529 RepID=UPI001C0BC40B|nr:hypothetical protein [Verticiella sp. GG226]MBU4611881.1 hypothetical protein [Verticiella sp. GG226]
MTFIAGVLFLASVLTSVQGLNDRRALRRLPDPPPFSSLRVIQGVAVQTASPSLRFRDRLGSGHLTVQTDDGRLWQFWHPVLPSHTRRVFTTAQDRLVQVAYGPPVARAEDGSPIWTLWQVQLEGARWVDYNDLAGQRADRTRSSRITLTAGAALLAASLVLGILTWRGGQATKKPRGTRRTRPRARRRA